MYEINKQLKDSVFIPLNQLILLFIDFHTQTIYQQNIYAFQLLDPKYDGDLSIYIYL
jgi:hypothetical protein